MWIKFLLQSSGLLLKLGYLAGMLCLYVTRPQTLSLAVVCLALFGLLALTAQTRR